MKALTIIQPWATLIASGHKVNETRLEIWADGSIQGYLSAKQTLKIIERIKARESPR